MKDNISLSKRITQGRVEIKHSLTKTAFNIIGTVLGGRFKIARVPYPEINIPNIDQREKNEAEANAELIALAFNLAQKHDPEQWEAKLDAFDEMKSALEEISAINKPESKEYQLAINALKNL